MSHTAHIRSHRKPRRSASTIAMRAGVAGGVLSTLAVAGASGSANAAEPVTQTLELPTLTADLAAQVAQSADVTQQAAASYELQAERDAAAAKAAKQAEADLAEAKKKAEEEKKKKAEEAARKAAAERASRTAERATLSASVDTGSSDSSGSSVSSSSATGSAAAVIAFVQAQVGDAYVTGGTGPNSWDCSGLVQAAFKQVNIDLPRVSQSQSTAGTQVSLDNLQPGDILYWGGAGSAYHVGVYVGDGMFVGAQNSSTGVVQAPLSYDPPSGAVRVL
ncbi:C40 family peptidase [Streptomyces mutabilis]|uniref:C40 family peptidase n=1 Tax=Streptomyces TaxID=1883 RepID=UPI000BC48601|nr:MULTISPECIES: C40 family peptidase [Streptomyces]MDG9691076.1 C40 family peptidase [Streptomyces sp. DH17]MCZ9353385.1 C40 family peptidase [Streptomyces mutabilis]MDN3246185.1 C40 family peptidase [Streptomyces sp. ZSW22]MDN3252513.1 C40 family peptidase [Streptomyces sp. MA25(2023)]MDQ0386069.1 cell wall-associated NlpC family hydrolase [Streptomyces sp. DSM 42143]